MASCELKYCVYRLRSEEQGNEHGSALTAKLLEGVAAKGVNQNQ